MARQFNVGRQSEQLYNEELHRLYKLVEHLGAVPESEGALPKANVTPIAHGALWLDTATDTLNYYNESESKWVPVFNDVLKLTRHIGDHQRPGDGPDGDQNKLVRGQLHLHQGHLMYWTGEQWQMAIAQAADDVDQSMYHHRDFVIISPVDPVGNTVMVEGTEMSQFIIPCTRKNRVFLDNELMDTHQVINPVAFQHNKAELVGKHVSAVHVDPQPLKNVRQYLIRLNDAGTEQHIKIPHLNCEYYAFNGAYGDFLIPRDSDLIPRDYRIASDVGVILEQHVAQNYDFVLIVQYEFGWFKRSGKLNTYQGILAASDTYYVGKLNMPFTLFAQSLNLEEGGYVYDRVAGTLTVPGSAVLGLSMVEAYKREYGFVAWQTPEGFGIVKARHAYEEPLLLINGMAQKKNSDYTVAIVSGKPVFHVIGAKRNMLYTIIETKMTTDDVNEITTFITDGVAEGSTINVGAIDANFLLFVNGFLLTGADRSYNGSVITVPHMIAGHKYIVYRSELGIMSLIEDFDKYTAVNTAKFDASLVFANNKLIGNGSMVKIRSVEDFVTNEYDLKGVRHEWLVEGRIVCEEAHYNHDLEKEVPVVYKEYDGTQWVTIVNPADKNKLDQLFGGYENQVNALVFKDNSLLGQSVKGYLYNFSSTIERGAWLASFNQSFDGSPRIVTMLPGHSFIQGEHNNSLSVYTNGLRQYEVEQLVGTNNQFVIPAGIGSAEKTETATVSYISEPLLSNSYYAAHREILTYANKITGHNNLYRTSTVSMHPGHVSVYIGGLRQSQEAYSIIDNHRILFKGTPAGGDTSSLVKNELKEVIGYEMPGFYGGITLNQLDEILIEVKRDPWIQEMTFYTKELHKAEYRIFEGDIDATVIDTQDIVKIYVNGLFVGNDYYINKERKSLVLTNMALVNVIGRASVDSNNIETTKTQIILEWR